MGLITLFLLGAFALLYISKTIEKKPEFVDKAVGFITANLDHIALGGLVFGFVAAFLAPLTNVNAVSMLLRLVANVILIVMALPFSFEKIIEKFNGKVNEAIVKELRNFINWTNSQQKIVGYVGAVAAVLLFADIFK